MEKKIMTIILALCTTLSVFSQDGTIGNPFTSLDQAFNATTSGIYHFDVGGNVFSTYVEGGTGWVLIASGEASTTESSYGRTSNLTLQSDMVLLPSIYADINVTAVRMNASAGPGIPFDVTSTNAAVLSNLRNDMTLSIGTNNTAWTGIGTDRLLRSCSSRVGSLTTHIYHACGNNSGLHWQVGRTSAHEKVIFNNSDKNDLNLWIQSDLSLLPIELSFFEVSQVEQREVKIEWETFTEFQNDYFTVERSFDGKYWEELQRIEGAGNSTSPLTYKITDLHPQIGWNYYRLKQTDYDGGFEYFEEKSIRLRFDNSDELIIFPNPAEHQIQIEGVNGLVQIFNAVGQDVSQLANISSQSETRIVIEVTNLNSGIYFVRNGDRMQSFVKK